MRCVSSIRVTGSILTVLYHILVPFLDLQERCGNSIAQWALTSKCEKTVHCVSRLIRLYWGNRKLFFSFVSFLFLISALVFCPEQSLSAVGSPPFLESAEIDRIIHVNNQHPKAKDTNPGTPDLPLKTIVEATGNAIRSIAKGFGTKIVVHPGMYREQIAMNYQNKRNDSLLVLEAEQPGTVVISGSDLWFNWEEVKKNKIYAHTWNYKWGLASHPKGWKHLKLTPIVRRREMVFVNGTALRQVLSSAEMTEGTFYVSEEAEKLYIFPQADFVQSSSVVEVATRSSLLKINWKENLILRGLTFQHAVSSLEKNAVLISNSRNVLIEDCGFFWNNWAGYNLHDVINVTTKRNVANFNGGVGSNAWSVKNFYSENDETSFNNWRGKQGGFFGWADAGSKHHRVHNALYHGQRSIRNYTRGFWLDSDNRNIVIENATWCENEIEGSFIEASPGPILIKNSEIFRNKQWGVRSTNSSNVILENNRIYNNALSQIMINGKAERVMSNLETNEQFVLKMEDWSIIGNMIGSDKTILFQTFGWEHFLKSLRSSGNLWQSSQSKEVFKINKNLISFPEWRRTTEQGDNSFFQTVQSQSTSFDSKHCSSN